MNHPTPTIEDLLARAGKEIPVPSREVFRGILDRASPVRIRSPFWTTVSRYRTSLVMAVLGIAVVVGTLVAVIPRISSGAAQANRIASAIVGNALNEADQDASFSAQEPTSHDADDITSDQPLVQDLSS